MKTDSFTIVKQGIEEYHFVMLAEPKMVQPEDVPVMDAKMYKLIQEAGLATNNICKTEVEYFKKKKFPPRTTVRRVWDDLSAQRRYSIIMILPKKQPKIYQKHFKQVYKVFVTELERVFSKESVRFSVDRGIIQLTNDISLV